MHESIPRKVGLKKGNKGDDDKKLQEYLKRFGYIKTINLSFGAEADLEKTVEAPRENEFDDNTVAALKRFQEFNKLPVTGILDPPTLKLMSRPRCGLPDLVKGKVQDYNAVGKWQNNNLTFTIENSTPDLSQLISSRAIQDAAREWTIYANINLTEVGSAGNIRLSWQAGDHGDGYPFDGASGVLAHGFYPEDGRLHFDEAETWTDDNPPSGIDLQTVALHELGHTLGLGHSSDTNAVMYAYYGGRRRSLESDDIDGIRSIYGARYFYVTTFSPWQGYAIPNGLWMVGDFSGDRRSDLLHAVQNSNYVHTWLAV